MTAERSQAWRTRAEDALARFEAADSGDELVHSYAFAAQARAWLYGWDDPWALSYLDKVRSKKNPDGGYGLNYADDAFSDGTVNPASTTYLVTITDHVGPVLLDAFRNGKATRTEVQTLVNLVLTAPQINTGAGQCVAYSRNTNDAKPGYCVHNVNASAARFLADAVGAGMGGTGLAKLIVGITRREVSAYQPTTPDGRAAWWYYTDGSTSGLNDADHNSFEAEQMYYLAYWVGREAAYQHMVKAWADNAQAPIAHMRLTALPGGPNSMNADGTTTMWCEMGDQWLPEFDSFLAAATSPQRMAQAAYYAARNSLACA